MFHENIIATYEQIISECVSNFEFNGLCMGRVWLCWVWVRWEGKGWKNDGGGGRTRQVKQGRVGVAWWAQG